MSIVKDRRVSCYSGIKVRGYALDFISKSGGIRASSSLKEGTQFNF